MREFSANERETLDVARRAMRSEATRCVASPRVAAPVPRVVSLSLSLSPSSINIRASTSTSTSRSEGNATEARLRLWPHTYYIVLFSRLWRPIRRSSNSADIGAPSPAWHPGCWLRPGIFRGIRSGESPRI